MKTVLKTLLMMIFFIPCPSYAALQPYNSATMNYEITPTQAITSIQIWSGNPSLSLTLGGVCIFPNSPGNEMYVFSAPVRQTFRINCHTGWLSYWTDHSEFDTYRSLLQANQSIPLSQSQLEQAAYNFARSHYPNFDQQKMQELSYDDGQVVFASQPVPGVWFKPNLCAIDIDNFTGSAFRYVAWKASSGITIPTIASLTASQAETTALNLLLTPATAGTLASKSDPVLSAFTTQPSELSVINDNLGHQRLVWMVYTAKSTTVSNYTFAQWVQNDYDLADSCEIGIDANTGAMVSYNAWLGGKEPTGLHSKVWHSRNVTKKAKHNSVVKIYP